MKYTVVGDVQIQFSKSIEANTFEEAVEMANEMYDDEILLDDLELETLTIHQANIE